MFKYKENKKSTYLRRSSDIESNKHNESHTKAHHNQVAEKQWQSESHKSS